MGKYREDQKELNRIFLDLEKAYGRVLMEELWDCARKCESDKNVYQSGTGHV